MIKKFKCKLMGHKLKTKLSLMDINRIFIVYCDGGGVKIEISRN